MTLGYWPGGSSVASDLKIRSATPLDAAALLAVRHDAIMALAEEYGLAEAERWANAPHANLERASRSIASNRIWVGESASSIVGWVELNANTIESLYVQPAAGRHGVGSALMTDAEHHARISGCSTAYLEASPNAEPFYARRGYKPCGERTENNALPMEPARPE